MNEPVVTKREWAMLRKAEKLVKRIAKNKKKIKKALGI